MAWYNHHYRYEVPGQSQTYWEHFRFSFTNSAIIFWAGLVGMFHAVFPWWAPFYTARKVVEAYHRAEASGRHDDLIRSQGHDLSQGGGGGTGTY